MELLDWGLIECETWRIAGAGDYMGLGSFVARELVSLWTKRLGVDVCVCVSWEAGELYGGCRHLGVGEL